MGVPVVTLTGRTAVSRGGSTLLSHAGLADLVADSETRYVDSALNLMRDPERLAMLRGSLRARLESSPLMDSTGFAADIESIFRRIWQRWCAS